ncbi:MAG TPA: hypothetical protein VHV32_18945 [Candidatus Angelobacter sp.]|jgi:ABC-type transporter Mla subunit MlaD|nr:hypothetical protein [Candidatus Angelobacter sp.]
MSPESDALGELIKTMKAQIEVQWQTAMQLQKLADHLERVLKLLPQPDDPRNKRFPLY